MDLEFLLDQNPDPSQYQIGLSRESTPAVVDWRPMVLEILKDIRAGVRVASISARFHNTLIDSLLSVARVVGLERVVLSGGCFQNRYLTEQSVGRLRESGFRPYWHQRVPPNDGGICLGQVVAARWWPV